MSKLSISLTSLASAAAIVALGMSLIFAGAPPSAAQQSQPPDARPKEPDKSTPRRDPGKEGREQRPSDPKADGKQAKPAPDGKDGKSAEADKAGGDAKEKDKQAKLNRPPQTAAEKARRLADLYAQLATAEDEEAAKKYASAIERLWTQSGSDTVNLLIERAQQAQKKKDMELAKKLLDHVVALAPDYPEAFNQRAYFHFTQNNYEAAVGDLRRVLALDPNHYKALEGLVQIWREVGNKKAAYGVLKQLMDVHPFAAGVKAMYEELKREADGQGI